MLFNRNKIWRQAPPRASPRLRARSFPVSLVVVAANGRMGQREGRTRGVGEDEIVELAELFRLMSDPTRLRIILACLTRPVAVTEMAQGLGLSASLVSHHLRLLRAARLLQADRQGRQVFYVVGDDHIRSMLTDMVDHVAEQTEEPDGA
jgi:DNA-binding transcriptional ArsR family regulator